MVKHIRLVKIWSCERDKGKALTDKSNELDPNNDDTDDDGLINVLDHDADGDNVLDRVDTCPKSDTEATIIIDGCDRGVENHIFEDGGTMSYIIKKALQHYYLRDLLK